MSSTTIPTEARSPKLPKHVIPIAAAIWVVLVGAGLKWISDYKTTAGALETTPDRWPAAASLVPSPGLFTLVMFVHPKCTCTRASLDELNEVMSRADGHAKAFVIFLHPEGVEPDWDKTDTWTQAGHIPSTTQVTDLDGAEAARFRAATSGQLVVYDPQGRLAFSGGITASRGHVGDNLGRESVLSLLSGGPAGLTTHPVFGCPLHETTANPGVRL